ncbi:MAG: hypothetical protein J4F45_00585 [Pseudomonadales bacterium]|nr:hypothetical protein [Pseudomonadales bacterium]
MTTGRLPPRGIAVGLLVLAAAWLAGGCVQTTVQGVRQAETDLGASESVVILSRKHKTQGETEDDFVACVSDYVKSGSDAVPILTEREFVDATFPWFEPRTAPLNMDDLTQVINRPLIAERIDEIGVRYLVWIEGQTRRSDQTGSLQCTMMTGGVPGCLGFLSWERGSNYEASVWDVRRKMTVGTLSSEAAGTSFVIAVVVPVPVIARVQEEACANLSQEIKNFLGPQDSSTADA